MKSLAHPEWPYAGTAHEWRGFVKSALGFDKIEGPVYADRVKGKLTFRDWEHWDKADQDNWQTVYQKQNFGPSLQRLR